ncbi:MAG: hypothetical protein R3Y36_03215 [Spirochaetales bacterium]
MSEDEVKNHPEYMCDSGQMSWDLQIDKGMLKNINFSTFSIDLLRYLQRKHNIF